MTTLFIYLIGIIIIGAILKYLESAIFRKSKSKKKPQVTTDYTIKFKYKDGQYIPEFQIKRRIKE